MGNHTTGPPSFHSHEFNLCNLDGVPRNHSSAVNAATFSIAIMVAIMSPLAVVGNTVILAVIWRQPSLRTPSYILLCGLAVTDLCMGLITQPFHVAVFCICLEKPIQDVADDGSPFLKTAVTITIGCGNYFGLVTVLTITLMSIERWLHMANRSLVTGRRASLLVVILMLLPIPLALFVFLDASKGSHGHRVNVAVFMVLLVCLITTTFAYSKVFRIIRAHQQQVQENQSIRDRGQPAIDLAKYKRSVFTILYILAVFYICYLPAAVMVGLFMYLDNHAGLHLPFQLTMMSFFLSSSLNPLLYVWRMKDIRAGVKQLLRQVLCKENSIEVQVTH